MFKKIKQGLAVLTCALAAGMSQADDKVLNFGIISTESSQNLRTIWDPFLQDMAKDIGVEVKAFFAPDYAGVIQGMRFDKVDVAWFGNKSAMEAVDRAGGEIFAQTVDSDGNPGYWSLLVTRKDSKLNSLEDIFRNPGDLVFGNGDPNSTSGFLVPSYYVFANQGVDDPKKIFKRVLNSNHETNLLAAATGKVDFATNNTENYRRLQVTKPEMVENIKIIWKSPLIPSDPIVWRTSLDDLLKDKVYTFFMTYGTTGDARELAVLKGLQWAPFRPSSNNQLIPIRQLVLFKQKVKIENDTAMSSAEKAKETAAIDAQLKGLERKLAALNAWQ